MYTQISESPLAPLAPLGKATVYTQVELRLGLSLKSSSSYE
jgi:hypothetical protein